MKLVDICKSREALERAVSNQWKKGNKPVGTKYDGAVTVRRMHSDGGVIPYKWIRISESNWEFLHRHLWKNHRGDIPPGHNVVFKDGDTLNCVIENLECISNAELCRRNSIHKLPGDVKELVYLKSSLTKAINKTVKQNGSNRKA